MQPDEPPKRPVDPGPPPSGRAQFLLIFPSVMLPMFLAMADQTIVATALPAIASDLGNVENIAWVVASYLLAATIAAPVYGRIGDFFGRRRMLVVGLVIFMAASALCSAANSLGMLILARTAQGLGGGGLMTLSQALIGESVAPRDRARYQGYLAAIALASSTLGPVMGGFLTQHFGWRSIFLVNIPVGLFALVLTLRLPSHGRSAQPFRFDLLGLLLFAIFVSSFLVMIQQMSRFDGRGLLLLVMLGPLSLLALFLLVWRERRAPQPLLPLALLRNPSIWRSDMIAACHGALLVSLITYLPLYLRVVHGASASEIGLLMLPMTIGIGLGSMLTGRLVGSTGFTAAFPSWGLIVVAVTLALLAVISVDLTAFELSLLLAFNAAFMGTVMSVVQVTVQMSVDRTMLGTAAATVQLSRTLGAALGTTIVGAILFGVIATYGVESVNLFARLIQQGPDILLALSAEARSTAQAELAVAFRVMFLTMAAFALIALVLAWSIPLRRI